MLRVLPRVPSISERERERIVDPLRTPPPGSTWGVAKVPFQLPFGFREKRSDLDIRSAQMLSDISSRKARDLPNANQLLVARESAEHLAQKRRVVRHLV